MNKAQQKHHDNLFNTYYKKYSHIVLEQINKKGYTTRNEVMEKSDISIPNSTKRYHFDRVINEIVQAYDLKYDFMKKEQKLKYNVPLKLRSRLIYKPLRN